ncbi:hypothetical protein BRARA_C03784 [Brassica rapa]|uniref:MATH domain-containing protein n=1 Tax=Brassica campestris TaxID=3711 RepID=A0A398A9I1_BRACM|nr:hypothetical protein BRARA_C03784 [Brassica rapa]
MMSYYIDTLCIISLLSCHFITSSFAGPVPNVPYSLKLESFSTLMKSTYTERYDSRPFRVGKYNWTLVVYPKGNKNDSGTGYISLYVAIDSSTLTSPRQVVPADLRFYVFNKKEKKYFTIQDSDVWQFTINKTMWGFPRVLPLSTFSNLKNGYLYDMDQCEFGVDITIPPIFEKSELFSVAKSFPNKRFTWFIQGFSTLPSDYLSEEFIIGGISWNLRVFRNGFGAHEGKNLSLYLNLGPQELLKTKPYDKIYARAMLRVPNQGQSNYIVERPLDNWFSPQNIGWGYADFMPLSIHQRVSLEMICWLFKSKWRPFRQPSTSLARILHFYQIIVL